MLVGKTPIRRNALLTTRLVSGAILLVTAARQYEFTAPYHEWIAHALPWQPFVTLACGVALLLRACAFARTAARALLFTTASLAMGTTFEIHVETMAIVFTVLDIVMSGGDEFEWTLIPLPIACILPAMFVDSRLNGAISTDIAWDLTHMLVASVSVFLASHGVAYLTRRQQGCEYNDIP